MAHRFCTVRHVYGLFAEGLAAGIAAATGIMTFDGHTVCTAASVGIIAAFLSVAENVAVRFRNAGIDGIGESLALFSERGTAGCAGRMRIRTLYPDFSETAASVSVRSTGLCAASQFIHSRHTSFPRCKVCPE